MAKIKLEGFQCERCNHQWAPRGKVHEPRVCPKCKSPYWNRPRIINKSINPKMKKK